MKKIEFDKLTPRQIVQAMVNGLKAKHVLVCMGSFGYRDTEGICYGCAATNTLCELAETKFTAEVIASTGKLASAVGSDYESVAFFETAIDALRKGQINIANSWLNKIGIMPIVNPSGLHLPWLDTDFTDKQLEIYQRLADSQA